MEYQGKTPTGPDPKEIKEVAWLPYQEALAKLTFKSERGILTKGKRILEKEELLERCESG